MIPTQNQWKKWTLPSKYSLIGVVIGIIGLGISIISYIGSTSSMTTEKSATDTITRAEFLTKTIQSIFHNSYIPNPEKDPFYDVPKESDGSGCMQFAKERGIVILSKSQNYRFYPNELIRRKEAVKIIANSMCLAQAKTFESCYINLLTDNLKFKDVDRVTEFLPFISYLVKQGVLVNEEYFHPNSFLNLKQSEDLISSANKALKRNI